MRKTDAEKPCLLVWKEGAPSQKVLDRLTQKDILLMEIYGKLFAVYHNDFGWWIEYGDAVNLSAEPVPFPVHAFGLCSQWCVCRESLTPFADWYKTGF